MYTVLSYIWLVLIGGARATLEQYRVCGRRDYCHNRSEEFLHSPQKLSLFDFFRSPCYCDDDCNKYNDCCIDESAWPKVNLYIENIPKSLWTCKPIGTDIGIYLVDDCKEESDVSSLCSREPIGDQYHYSLDLPVYSTKTGIYYANVYCAICHKDANNLQALKTVLQCNGSYVTLERLREEGEYLPGLRTWKAGNETCTMIPADLTLADQRARRCVPSIADCPSTWDDVIVRDKCNAYQLLVKDNVSVYKNPHCAICNGVQPTHLHCWHIFYYKGKVDPSLYMIFDFNWNPNSCPLPKSVWDGLHGICRDMPCNDPSCHMNECQPNDSAYNHSDCEESTTISADMLTLKIEGYLTVACLAISIFCLLLHNIVFYTLPKQKNLPSRILNSLSWALIVAQTLFLVGVSPIVDIPNYVCKGVAVLIQFYYLSAFFWMNVMSIDIWHTFSKNALNTCKERTHTKYALYAWGSAFLITAFALFTDLTSILPKEYRPYYAAYPGVCWFANRIGLGIFFYAPICVILCINAVLFTITVCWFQKQANNAEVAEASGRKEYIRLWLYVKLSTIMGLAWAFAMIAALAHRPKFWYPFILLNGLQGAFIFLMFDLKSNTLILFCESIGLKHFLKGNGKKSVAERGGSSKLSTSLTSRRTSVTKV